MAMTLSPEDLQAVIQGVLAAIEGKGENAIPDTPEEMATGHDDDTMGPTDDTDGDGLADVDGDGEPERTNFSMDGGAAPSPTNVAEPARFGRGQTGNGRVQAGNGRPVPRAPVKPTPAIDPGAELVRLRRRVDSLETTNAHLRQESERRAQETLYLQRFGRIHPLLLEINESDEARAAEEADKILARPYTEELWEDKVEDLTRLARLSSRPTAERISGPGAERPKYTDPNAPLPDEPDITRKLARFGRKWADKEGLDFRELRVKAQAARAFNKALAEGKVDEFLAAT